MPRLFSTEDLDALAELGGDVVVCGGVTGKGFFDIPDEEVLPGGGAPQRGGRPSIKVRTGKFPALASGAALTVNGVAYTVRLVQRIENGDYTEAFLDTA